MSDAFGPDQQRPGGRPPPSPGSPPPGAHPPPAPPPGGAPPPAAPPPGAPPAWSPGPAPSSTDSTDNNGVALAAMIVGIASLAFGLIGALVLPLFLSIPGGVVAIILGAIGRSRAKAGAPRSGQAIAGLITGSLALVVSAVWIGLGVVLGGQFMAEFSDEVAELEACLEETGDRELCQERFSEEVFEWLDP